MHSKRGLYTQQKRPTCTAKEASIHSKRGLYTQQKRPVYTAKEAYIYRPESKSIATASFASSTLVAPCPTTYGE